MPFDKSRNGQVSLKFQNLGRGTHIAVNVGIAADGNDSVPSDGNCFSLGNNVVDSNDLAIAENEIGRVH